MRTAEGNFDEILGKLKNYFPNDGHLLDWETMDAFEAIPAYIETEHFICVHASVPLSDEKYILPLEEAETEQLVDDRSFKEQNVLPKDGKCVLFGHTPTRFIAGASGEDEILFYPRIENPRRMHDFYKIHLDMGTMYSKMLGCLCAETLETFYVTKDEWF